MTSSEKIAMTTSKKLTWIVVIAYFATIYIAMGLDAGFKTNFFTPSLKYLTPIVATVILSYFGKAGVENYKKIK